jgi:hypothetical protein
LGTSTDDGGKISGVLDDDFTHDRLADYESFADSPALVEKSGGGDLSYFNRELFVVAIAHYNKSGAATFGRNIILALAPILFRYLSNQPTTDR